MASNSKNNTENTPLESADKLQKNKTMQNDGTADGKTSENCVKSKRIGKKVATSDKCNDNTATFQNGKTSKNNTTENKNGIFKSKTKQKISDKKYVVRTLIILTAIFGTFVAFMLIFVPENRTAGTISAQSTVRSGSPAKIVYHLDKTVKTGDNVSWYVDGKKVSAGKYDGKSIVLNYTPSASGLSQIAVKAGKYTAVKTVVVKKPLITVKADDVTMYYGDDDMELTCTATLGDGTTMPVNCNCRVVGENIGIGSYRIIPSGYNTDEYDVFYKCGTLTVKPCELNLAVNKTYDGSRELSPDDIEVNGIMAGDDVTVNAVPLYTESKNVGEYQVDAQAITLEGADSGKYVLPEKFVCTVQPKRLTVTGVSAYDKLYDGTTKATVQNAGMLDGVAYGDNVAIGELEISFESGEAGTQNIKVDSIAIVGADKNNYYVDKVFTNQAVITQEENSTADNSVKTAD